MDRDSNNEPMAVQSRLVARSQCWTTVSIGTRSLSLGSYRTRRPGIPPQSGSSPVKNFHDRNEISQMIHVHNISTVPLECPKTSQNQSQSIYFSKISRGGRDVPRSPWLGPAKANPPPQASMWTFAISPPVSKSCMNPCLVHHMLTNSTNNNQPWERSRC